MNIQQKIDKYCQHNWFIPMRNKGGSFKIHCPFKDINGNWRTSSWHNSLEECKESLGTHIGYTKEEIGTFSKGHGWTLLENEAFTIYDLDSFVPYEKGDSVMCGEEKHIISSADDLYRIVYEPGFLFAHHQLKPYFEEEPKEEEDKDKLIKKLKEDIEEYKKKIDTIIKHINI